MGEVIPNSRKHEISGIVPVNVHKLLYIRAIHVLLKQQNNNKKTPKTCIGYKKGSGFKRPT